MQIIWGGASAPDVNAGIAEFVALSVPGCERGFGPCATMGVVRGGVLIAGIVYHNWSPETGVIEISGAATDSRWMTRQTLRAMFSYPFDEIGCQMVVARHSEHNARLRRMWRAVGSSEFVIPRLMGRNEAMVVTTLTDDAWRKWINRQ
jgi:RimJ/RimL family protein N-acetyltransferase